jgi:hypothetical protein
MAATTCYSMPGAHYYIPKCTLGSRFCYSACTRRLLSPQNMEALPTVPDSKRALAPPKSKNAILPTEGQKAITCYSAGSTRSPVTLSYREAQHFTLHLPAGQPCLSCPRDGISAPPLSSNLLLCWCEEACPTQCTETQHSPLCLHESPHAPIKELELQLTC